MKLPLSYHHAFYPAAAALLAVFALPVAEPASAQEDYRSPGYDPVVSFPSVETPPPRARPFNPESRGFLRRKEPAGQTIWDPNYEGRDGQRPPAALPYDPRTGSIATQPQQNRYGARTMTPGTPEIPSAYPQSPYPYNPYPQESIPAGRPETQPYSTDPPWTSAPSVPQRSNPDGYGYSRYPYGSPYPAPAPATTDNRYPRAEVPEIAATVPAPPSRYPYSDPSTYPGTTPGVGPGSGSGPAQPPRAQAPIFREDEEVVRREPILTPAPPVRQPEPDRSGVAANSRVDESIGRGTSSPSLPSPPARTEPTPAPQREPEPSRQQEQVGNKPGSSTPAPQYEEDLPYAKPVPGKSGFVTLPDSGLPEIDVRGIAPGTPVEVDDPKRPGETIQFRVP